MTESLHERARQLIALSGAKGTGEDFADGQEAWLRLHLGECSACRDYAERAGLAVRALRSEPLAADSALVRATQMRVRSRALELRQRQERIWLVSLSCLFVGFSAALTTPVSWRAFEWMGVWAGVSSWIWQASFTFFWIVPPLVVSLLLLARGAHLTDGREKQ
jgi:predicted anti-sigma-YlaC factor YlaD